MLEHRSALIAIGRPGITSQLYLFILPKTEDSRKPNAPRQIQGVLGVHVDNGISRGDEIFNLAIERLEKKFPFRSKKTFPGNHATQEPNRDIRRLGINRQTTNGDTTRRLKLSVD